MPSANASTHSNRSISPIIVTSTYFAYNYDAASRITKIDREAGLATYYSYDNANRLTGEMWTSSGTTIYAFTYDYDAVGNRTYESRNGVETYYTYDAANELLQSHNVTDDTYTYYTYDANGNCTSISEPDGTTYFAYNDADLVKQITFKSGITNYFYYDALMRRYAIQESTGTTYFIWDKNGLNLLAEKDSSGNVIAEYIHGYTPIDGIGSLVAAKKMVGSTAYYQYPHYDHRGSVVTLTDKNGSVVASYLYDAWGNILNSTESAETEAVGNRFKYQSNWMYMGEGLYLSPTRVYHAGVGRFLQPDPLYKVAYQIRSFSLTNQAFSVINMKHSLEDAINMYSYVGNEPALFFDPFGLKCKCGKEIGETLKGLIEKVKAILGDPANADLRHSVCFGMWNPLNGWDINELAGQKEKFKSDSGDCGKGDCKDTASVNGVCYKTHGIYYILWGAMSRMCYNSNLTIAVDAVGFHRLVNQRIRVPGDPLELSTRIIWTRMGYEGKYKWENINDSSSFSEKLLKRSMTGAESVWLDSLWNQNNSLAVLDSCDACGEKYDGDLTANLWLLDGSFIHITNNMFSHSKEYTGWLNK